MKQMLLEFGLNIFVTFIFNSLGVIQTAKAGTFNLTCEGLCARTWRQMNLHSVKYISLHSRCIYLILITEETVSFVFS